MEYGIETIKPELRLKDVFHHIDMGFLNRRLCLTFLGADRRSHFHEYMKSGEDHFTQLSNDHLLVTMVIDLCDDINVPTLQEAITAEKPKRMFRSTEKLAPCPEVYDSTCVDQNIHANVKQDKPLTISYHTEHIVSTTGREALAGGIDGGYKETIVGLLHDKSDHYEIEPLIMGAPWFDHPRNGDDSGQLMWLGTVIGEILPEDIEQFSSMRDVEVESADEWMKVMKRIPEQYIKEAFASLLCEPTKNDWGGEKNDHFSASVTIGGRRKTAAFLLKGPSKFSEMTLDMCGKRADQIQRLTGSGAEISIVQHAHLIGEIVRETLRQFTVYPGNASRKYCLIDGQATYRILKANGLLDKF